VLFEFSIEASASKSSEVTLLDGTLHAEVRNRATPWSPMNLRLQLQVDGTAPQQPPPASIMGALSTLALYRLQERARQEAKAGEYEVDEASQEPAALRVPRANTGYRRLPFEAQNLSGSRS
jgi:hypothetical protein